MRYVIERDLIEFPFWCGGLDAIKRISASPDYNEVALEEFVMEQFSETPTEEEINDFFWFEQDYIMETLGWREIHGSED